MPEKATKNITIAVVTDLIFATKITGTAKALGRTVAVARSLEKLAEHLTAANEAGARILVIVDLNAAGVDALAAIETAKKHPAGPRVVGYFSHVQADLAVAARRVGADEVMARSVFVDRLAGLLGELGPPTEN